MMIEEAKRQARVLFAGDIRLFDAFSGALFDENVQALSDACDIRCCNFEGAAFHKDAATHKKAGPAVMQGKNAPARILDAGFNLITLANNHVMDYGVNGLFATLAAFSPVPLVGAGLRSPEAYRPYIAECNGVKLGFLAVSERQYGTLDGSIPSGTAWVHAPQTMNNIRLLCAECAHVIVLVHAGLEDVGQPLPEWRALYKQYIDAGATAVVCHHPHVPQGWERYKNGVIFYSLGNCAWEPVDEFPSQKSLLVRIAFDNHRLVDFSVRPVEYRDGQLRFDDSDGTRARLDALNGVLHDDAAYALATKRICRAFFEDVALPDFFTITGALPGGGWQQFKNASKMLLRKRALNEPLLKHMLDNESYRYAVSNALRHDAPEMEASQERKPHAGRE